MNFFGDLGKLGDVVGEALKNATANLEKGVDDALGIDGKQGSGGGAPRSGERAGARVVGPGRS